MNDQYLAYISDRVQKITEALYRVTGLLHDKEPLKWETRDKAICIFNKLISLRYKNDLERNISLEEVEKEVSELVIFLSLFSENQSVSGMNFQILKNEYSGVKKSITQKRQGDVLIGQGNGHKINEKSQMSIKNNSKNSNKNNDRKDKILNFMKNLPAQAGKKEVSISDLSVVFSDFSEKTIQRDLLDMVDKGLLKKEGDKRWRRYILAID